LATFLPHHTLPVFQTLMSVLPTQLPHDYKFLDPYVRSLTLPPRAAIVQQAIQNASFLSGFSQHVLLSCRLQQHHAAQVTFWAGLMTEATNGLLDKARSGRKSIQAGHDQALLQQLGPTISEAMNMSRVPELQIASYMVVSVLAAKGVLGDAALSAFMEQTVHAWTTETLRPGLYCLALLAHFRSSKQVSSKVTRALLKLDKGLDVLREVAHSQPVDKLLYGVSLSAVDRLARKGDIEALPSIKAVLLSELLLPKQISVIVKTLLIAAHRIVDNGGDDAESRKLLAYTLATLTQAGGQSGNIIRAAVQDAEIDVEALELSLDTLIRPIANHEPSDADVNFDTLSSPIAASISVEETLARLPDSDAPSTSCLSRNSTSPFDDICAAFLSMASDASMLAQLDRAPALRREFATRHPFYFSFYARVWCGPYSTLARVRALEKVIARIEEADCRQLDLQALIPYCLTALCDDAKRVRSAAAVLMMTLGTLHSFDGHAKRNVWGSKDLYDRASEIKWMESQTVEALLHSILLPTLEESILQSNHSSTVLGETLNSSSKGGGTHNLSRSARLEIFRCLASHILQTPLLSVILRLLQALNLVRGVSDITRTQLLLPWLREWANLSAEVASGRAVEEKIEEQTIDHETAKTVLPNDGDGLDLFLDLIRKPEYDARQGLLRAIFERLSSMWSSMKVNNKLLVARTMLTVSLRLERHSNAALGAADFLQSVHLPTTVLQEFLEELHSIVGAVADVPPSKRRRTSSSDHSRVAGSVVGSSDVAALLQKYTFVLELVEGATPVKHPELLQSLFMTLSDLQHLRAVVGSDLGYLQNLALGSLLAMMPAYEANKDLKIDTSVGHGDILVSYIQKSASPAVQNAALLLVATLAKTAPDVVLHSVMPIFTFMGTSILRQGDEYSAHVINQTIKDVIPPLINTFRKSRRNIVASAVDLLSSFVIAYEHIPSHRKNELFLSLIDNLGADDFLFALLAMFIDKYETPPPLVAFLSHIMETFRVEVQLQTLIKFMDLMHDVFRPKPGLSAVILGRYDDGEKALQKVVANELTLLSGLLGNRRLKADMSELAQQDDMESARTRDLYAHLLQSTLGLANEVKSKKMLHGRCGDVLSSLLNLLSVPAFIRAAESLLDRSKSGLRTRVLQALQSRVDAESANSADSRSALLAFLPQLTADIRETDDIPYKLAAVSCVDKIAEKYGKKDVESVAAAAEAIAGPQCLGQPDRRLRTISLLCLASLADVLQDALVPILPSAIPMALDYLRASLDPDAYDVSLHNAALTFLTAVVQHLPFMVSESYLTGTFVACNLSAEVVLDEDAVAQRKACLAFLAKRVDSKVFFPALERNFAPALQAGPQVRVCSTVCYLRVVPC
jgi:U3 small nucleolar RNA-associated protein 10